MTQMQHTNKLAGEKSPYLLQHAHTGSTPQPATNLLVPSRITVLNQGNCPHLSSFQVHLL